MLRHASLSVVGLLLLGHFQKCSYAAETTIPDLIARVEPAIVRIDVHQSVGESKGSGFIIDGGFVVTNYHVIDQASSAEVVFADKSKSSVLGIRAYSPDKDLAILEVQHEKTPTTLRIVDSPPRKGETVVAFGAPMGFAFTVTQGIVSSVRNGAEIKEVLEEYDSAIEMTWIQTTAAISTGNSGGPLVDLDGKVVGVNAWTYKSGQNLNFSVSSIHLKELLAAIETKPLVPLGQQPRSSNRHDHSEFKAQLVFDFFAQAKFEQALSVERKKLESRAKELHSAHWGLTSNAEMMKVAQIKFDEAVEGVRKLRDFNPGVPKLLSEENAVFGKPGEWYVFQILSPDTFLAKPAQYSDMTFRVQDVSTVGKVDGTTYEFDGVWYTLGETYTYVTLAGSSRTIYVLRKFPLELSDSLENFRQNHILPAIDAVVSAVPAPASPTGDELAKLTMRREQYRTEQKERERLEWERKKREYEEFKRREQVRIEERATAKLELAKTKLHRQPDIAARLLRETVRQFPGTKAATESEEILAGKKEGLFRTWTSGRFSTKAILLRVEAKNAFLKKTNGKTISVPIEKLSFLDQAYIIEQTGRRAERP
jgi:hypothetical protein